MAAATASERLFDVSQWLMSSFTSVFRSPAQSNLADNRAQRAQSESLHVFPSGYHTTLSVQGISSDFLLNNYACCNYRDRLCRPYDWGLPEFHGTPVSCLDTRRSEDQSSERRSYSDLRAIPGRIDRRGPAQPTFTSSYAEAIPGAEVVFIAVGTPPTPSGRSEPGISCRRRPEASGSTWTARSPSWSTNRRCRSAAATGWARCCARRASSGTTSTLREFAVASNPEFLREGSALHDSLYPDRIVIGADEPRALEVLYSLYRPILDQTFIGADLFAAARDRGRRAAAFRPISRRPS